MKTMLLLLLLCSSPSWATYSSGVIVIDPVTGVGGNVTVDGAQQVDGSAVTQPISALSLPLPSGAALNTSLTTINTTLGSPFQVGGSIGNSSFGISGTLPAFASTPTFNLGTLNGAALNSELVTINTTLGSPFQSGGSIGNSSFGISGTLPAYGSTPTFNLGSLNGASTAANQATQITSLATLNTTLGSPFQSGGSIGNTSFGISGTLPAFSSPPTVNLGTIGGASTAANQATAQTSLTAIAASVAAIPASPATAGNQTTANASLSSIDSKLTNPLPVNGTVTSTQTALVTGQINNSTSVTTTASTFTAPANAIGFVLEAESGNTDNIRWAVGSTATASVGMLAEPGRDSGYVPLAANISVISISGTQSASVQWVVR